MEAESVPYGQVCAAILKAEKKVKTTRKNLVIGMRKNEGIESLFFMLECVLCLSQKTYRVERLTSLYMAITKVRRTPQFSKRIIEVLSVLALKIKLEK